MQQQITKPNEARLTISELAHRLGLSRESVYKAIRNGEIPHLRIGRRIVIPRTAIERWEASAGQRDVVNA